MKKLLGIAALAALLAACSQHDRRPPPPPQGEQAQQHAQIEAALKSCHEELKGKKDEVKFDACMNAKGFEKPQDKPHGKAPKAPK